jgi:3-oxoadipate enol-lactonase
MTVDLDATTVGPDNGPVILLGGSLGTTRDMWLPQLPALSKRCRVVAFDHRGHGASPVPSGPYTVDDLGHDVLRLADRFGIDRFSYAGLSLGGMVGMWLAATAPDRVGRLALLCTSAYLGPESGYRERADVVRGAGTEAVADAVVARWFTAQFRSDEPDVVARFRAMLVGEPAEGYAGCCEAIADMDLRERLAEITAETLVIAADYDVATPSAHAEGIVAGVRGARLFVVPAAAHLANVEQPDVVTRLLVEHLGGD